MAQRAPQTFSKGFLENLNDLERRALQAGTNLTAASKKIGISRSTPDRWRRKVPKTLKILDQLEAFILAAEEGCEYTIPHAKRN
jgi:hypothetical protein